MIYNKYDTMIHLPRTSDEKPIEKQFKNYQKIK